jgi:predicted membrane protein
MPGQEQQTRQPDRPRYRGGDSTVGIIILALIVFFFVNGPGSHASERRGVSTESDFSETAVLGGVDRQNNSQKFHGGEATAFMGGVKLDLREAVMEGSEATIDVTTVMGGVELHIPREWTIVNRVTPVLGGVEDHTRSGDGSKRLIVEGTVVMGGLNISN